MIRYTDVRLDASSLKELPDGSIKVVAQLTHPGVFTYKNPDGSSRKEYRPADVVFRKDTLDSFAAVPVTLNHPRQADGQRKVSAASWKKDAVGHMGENVRQDGQNAVGDVYVREDALVRDVKAGKVQFVSAGYDVDYDPTPGVTPDGQRYDGTQTAIRGNHVALLPSGVRPRGGSECMLRLDSAGDEEYPRTDGLNSNVTPEQIIALEAKLTALTGELEKARTDSADLAGIKTKLAAAETAVAELTAQVAPERLDALVEERSAVTALAKSAGIETAGKSTLAVKRALVAKNTPALAERVDSMSAETVDAVLAVYKAQPHPSLKSAVDVTMPAVDTARTDATPAKIPTVAELQNKFNKASREAWKNEGHVPVRN